ncbi:MAG TPA: hypothetical protein VGO67_11165 [Verrucomicrobiae bacterium]|jgi:hypothetical protein
MTIGYCLFLVSGCGAAGGLLTCFHKDAILWPKFDKVKRIWRPGVIGSVVVGAFAAAVLWTLYGPASSFDLANPTIQKFSLPLSQIGSSILVGFSGGKVLTLLAQKQADHVTTDEMSKTLKDFLEKQGK